MISDFFINLAQTIVTWFLSLFPTSWSVPDGVLHFDTTLNGFLAGFAGMGGWVPWAYLTVLVGIVLVSWVIAAGIKVVRWIIGLIPTMGGGT